MQLILVNQSEQSVTPLDAALIMQSEVVANAQLVQAVTNPIQNRLAVETLKDIKRYRKQVKDAHDEVKRPIIDLGRRVEETTTMLDGPVATEERRIALMQANYFALETAKARDAERARNEELSRVEREKAAKLAAATSIEQREQIRADACQKVQEIAQAMPVSTPTREDGQSFKEEWEFEIEDVFLLIKMHPNFVNVAKLKECFSRLDIKDALKSGMKIHGIRAWKKPSVSQRLAPERPAIDV
jgi:hypothetical protein